MRRLLPLLALAALISVPAFAQVDLSGVWNPTMHEDNAERGLGPELADFLGLPINAAARQWARPGTRSWRLGRVTKSSRRATFPFRRV